MSESSCICHFAVNSVQRSQGRSVTAAIAYRDGVKIKDERSGKTFDFSRRNGVAYHGDILPTGVTGCTTAKLWNAAELAEKRINSVVGREYVVALPCELTPEERKKLAVDFARKIVERYGVAANVAVHEPGKEGDQRNHHAHIMTSTRVLTAAGFGAKTRILDAKQTRKAEISALRDIWAKMANEALEKAGSERRMDARSFAGREIEREPEIHLGPEATATERKGKPSKRGDLNRKIRERNATKNDGEKPKNKSYELSYLNSLILPHEATPKPVKSDSDDEKLKERRELISSGRQMIGPAIIDAQEGRSYKGKCLIVGNTYALQETVGTIGIIHTLSYLRNPEEMKVSDTPVEVVYDQSMNGAVEQPQKLTDEREKKRGR